MEIRNYKETERADNPHGIQSSRIYDREHGEIMHLLLKAGEALKPHITPVDVAFYVLEGEPTIMVGDERVRVKRDDIIESPGNIVHSIFNETDSDVRVLVMKLPKPVKKTILV